MLFPIVTSVYAALLALIYLVIAGWVGQGRHKYGVRIGDGGCEPLICRMRAQANFVEYVPLALILIALLEGRRTSEYVVSALLAVLTLARIIHPFGMVAAPGSWQQPAFRGLGATATFLVLLIAAVMLLLEAVVL